LRVRAGDVDGLALNAELNDVQVSNRGSGIFPTRAGDRTNAAGIGKRPISSDEMDGIARRNGNSRHCEDFALGQDRKLLVLRRGVGRAAVRHDQCRIEDADAESADQCTAKNGIGVERACDTTRPAGIPAAVAQLRDTVLKSTMRLIIPGTPCFMVSGNVV